MSLSHPTLSSLDLHYEYLHTLSAYNDNKMPKDESRAQIFHRKGMKMYAKICVKGGKKQLFILYYSQLDPRALLAPAFLLLLYYP